MELNFVDLKLIHRASYEATFSVSVSYSLESRDSLP